ncbi:TetR family transcriptional regulator [Luteibacter rhizovicinus DSM 16549]|uniref:TetR family transcriptional regulator n=1 Tax=Luteibacter rhizovicinus DSM 16549 TaxID=1440763 RepID=A0A0G9H0W4_9GAMM|nr:TetR/AcrR family transcriptional regulator [Luteibacter rhizovicinus]APG03904.1 TetR family transcriptional regulator [Luteibacter rhizovicinus DSM 16549]KLD63485.1 TetR family transcriptional regulator [Luteibacter rhizovicinus DSM 16549]KLD75496.1 TetR family transcriptional regulator [Xanthomonas hyacinthi DSM 19077]
MSKPDGLRNQKKAETRQAISHVATRLFIERGFDNVSVAEVAREAGVARKTVFNYFLRKEDLIFDREEEVRALVRDAIAGRGAQSPVRAFEAAMRALVDTGHPIFQMSARPIQFWRTVVVSPSLTTYARELRVTLGDDLAAMLADALGRPPTDSDARLAASMLVSTLVVAYGDALRAFREGQDPVAAFVRVMEQGFKGVDAALARTPYV